MMRIRGWPERLTAFLEASRTRAYALGTWDCAIFCALGVEAVTGALPVALAGHYATPLAMRRVMRRTFGASLTAGVDRVLAVPRSPVRQARRGDVLLRVDAGGVEHLALCGGPSGLAPAEVGLYARPLADFSACWRVG